MKKFIPILMALMIAVPLTACGSQVSDSSADSASPVSEESSSAQEDSSSEDMDYSADEDEADDDAELDAFSNGGEISKTVLYNESDVKITATKLTYESYAAELELMIENNSEEDLSFLSNTSSYHCNSINGIMIEDGYFNCDVAAGKKAKETVEFGYDGLMLYGINEIADMEIGIDIEDDDYNSVYTGPLSIKTSMAKDYKYDDKCYQNAITSDVCKSTFDYSIEYFDTENVYSEDGIEIVSSGIMINKDGEQALLLETNNTSEKPVTIYTYNISLNGLLVHSSIYSGEMINAGKKAIVIIKLSDILKSEFWDAYGINRVGEVSFEVDLGDYDGNIINEKKTVKVKASGSDNGFDKSGNEIYSDNGIRIIPKGLVESASDYNDDMYALFLVENTGKDEIQISNDYESLSVNDLMNDYYMTNRTIPAGESGTVVVTLTGSSLEENGISSKDDISELEFGVEIEKDYDTIDNPTLKIEY